MKYPRSGRFALIVITFSLLPCQAGTISSDPYELGKQALDNKSYAEAEQELAAAESARPGTSNALALRAKALIHLDRFEDAEQCLRVYLQRHPESPDANYLLAYVLFRRNEPAQSLAMYTTAARLQRPQADDFKIVGLDYVLLNDYSDAITWLERSVSENHGDPEALYYLGRAYYVQNLFDQAINSFTRALAIDPSLTKAHDNLGLAYEGKNDLALAEASYRKAIATGDSAHYVLPYLNLADLLRRTGRNQEALSLLDSADRISGASAKSNEIRARILLADGQVAGAERAARNALQFEPKNRTLHYLLGRVLKEEGKTADAEQEFAETRSLLQ